jgi:hypothetical protein
MYDIVCRYKYVADFMNVELDVLNLETRGADNSMFVKHMKLLCCVTMVPEDIRL